MVEVYHWLFRVWFGATRNGLGFAPGNAVQRQAVAVLGEYDVLLVCIPIQCAQLPKVLGCADSGDKGFFCGRFTWRTSKAVEEHLRTIVEPGDDRLREEQYGEAEERLSTEDGEANEEGEVFLE